VRWPRGSSSNAAVRQAPDLDRAGSTDCLLCKSIFSHFFFEKPDRMSRSARWHVRRGHSFVVRSRNASVRCPNLRKKRKIDMRNISPTPQTSDLARSVKKEEKGGRVQKFLSCRRPRM